jgi:hypothetical protein
MPPAPSPLGKSKSLLANQVLHEMRAGNDPEKSSAVADRRRDHAAALLEQRVRAIVAKAPPLTNSQRARIIQALAPGSVVSGEESTGSEVDPTHEEARSV